VTGEGYKNIKLLRRISIYAHDVNLLRDNVNTIKKNIEAQIFPSK
jgi:hypothetical protein